MSMKHLDPCAHASFLNEGRAVANKLPSIATADVDRIVRETKPNFAVNVIPNYR
jgi:hypothetical protein